MKTQKSESETKLTHYSDGAVVAIGVSGVISCYVYQSKTPRETPVNQPKEAPAHRPKETSVNKFDEKKRIVNYLYRPEVLSLFVFGYLMLG